MGLEIKENILYRKAQGITDTIALKNLESSLGQIEKDYKVQLPREPFKMEYTLELSKKGSNGNINISTKGANLQEILGYIHNEFGISSISTYDKKVIVQAQYQLSNEVLDILNPKTKKTPSASSSGYSSNTQVFM